MTFKKKDLVNIEAAIRALLDGKTKSKKLAYALVKNSKILEAEVTAIKEAFDTESEGYKEYLSKLREIYNIYGAKDAKGKVKITPNGFELAKEEDREKVTAEIKTLEENYKEAIEVRANAMTEYQAMLDTDIELNLQSIEFDSLPEEINPEIMYILDAIITEPK